MKQKVRYIHEIKTATREKHNFIILSASKPKIRGLHSSLPLFPVGSKCLLDVQVDTIRNVFVDYKELMVMEKYKEVLNNFENYPKSFL